MEEKKVTQLVVIKDGPIMVDGLIDVSYNGVGTVSEKCFLCRCGASSNKPYCDGSHKKIEFKD